MIRVLTLSTLYPDASRPLFGPFVERQTLALAARTGVEVRVVAPIGIPPLARRLRRYATLAALPYVEDRNGLRVYRPRFTHVPFVGARFDPANLARQSLPLLKRIRAEFPFDVIDCQFFFPDGPAAIALGREVGVPVSIKARGSDIHLWADSPAARRQIVAAGCGADGLLAVSAALRADMIALGMPGKRIAVHYTGIDHAVFRVRDRVAAKARLGIARPLIVSMGNLIERKGQHLLIEALVQLPGVMLALIGTGPMRAKFARIAVQYGVADRVIFCGSLFPPEIADWLGAADVMALPSVSEGLANAWIEALACGTPIVIPDVGGAREVLNRPEAGRLSARNPSAIAGAIVELIDNPPAREVVAQAASQFGWDVNASQLEQHLRALRERQDALPVVPAESSGSAEGGA